MKSNFDTKLTLDALVLSRAVYKDLKDHYNANGYELQKTIIRDETECFIFHNKLEKMTIVAFRGSTSLKDWKRNLKIIDINFLGAKVHKGFAEAYKNIRMELLDYLTKEQFEGKIEKLTFTGHSLGGAIANLAFLEQFEFSKVDTTGKIALPRLLTFGCPRVFKEVKDRLNKIKYILRIVNSNDIVCKLPPTILGYRHIGLGLVMDKDDKTKPITNHFLSEYEHELKKILN